MSQEELHHLLEELIEQSPLGSRELSRLKKLALEQKLWEIRLQQSKELFKRWRADHQRLQHLINEHLFDEAMKKLGHPYRILGGPVQLDQAHQQLAMAELALTLRERQDIEVGIAKLAQAIHLYYREYFKDQAPPPQEDSSALVALQNFNQDPQKGASPEWIEYLEYTHHLDQLSECKEKSQLTSQEVKIPQYATILHAEMYDGGLPKWVREWLLMRAAWSSSHIGLLEQLFEQENEPEIGLSILKILESLTENISLSFINRQLQNHHFSELLQGHLKSFSHQKLTKVQHLAIEENCDALLGAINNLIGIDSPTFYNVLQEHELQNGVFSQIIDNLSTNKVHREYGMDQLHLQRILEQQEARPQNVIAILQRMLPRGLESKSLLASLEFFDRLNERVEELRDGLSTMKREDVNMLLQQKRELTDTEAIRFILFSHLHDRIISSRAVGKALGLSTDELAQKLQSYYQFELTTGLNRNITNFIEHLWQGLPQLAPPLQNPP